MDSLDYNQLCKLHSQERIDSYAECFPNNTCTDEEKIEKYYDNIEHCTNLWKDIVMIEIAIRNKIVSEVKLIIPMNWMQGIIIYNNKKIKYLKAKQKKVLISELQFINSQILKNKEPEAKFISSVTFGFWHSLTKVMRHGFQWEQTKKLKIDSEDILKFSRLRNLVAHHENLLKINKKVNMELGHEIDFKKSDQIELKKSLNNFL